MIDTSRKLDHAVLERAARARGYWPIRLCYEEALRQTEKLHATLRIQISVLPSGVVTGTRITQSTSQDQDLPSCVGRALRKLTLPAGAKGTGLATLEVSLWPGDAPVAHGTKSDPALSLPVPAQDLTASLRHTWPDIAHCYGEGLRHDSGLWGRMALELEVGVDGMVKSIRETESHFQRTEVTECVKHVLLSHMLPRSERPMHFVYALRFGTPLEPKIQPLPASTQADGRPPEVGDSGT